VALSYRLHLLGSRWAVYDIAVDGISLVSSYRSQFARIIQTSSYEELLRRLRSREAVATAIEPTAAAR
jgi:phospholipid transport system substrate-binding protein